MAGVHWGVNQDGKDLDVNKVVLQDIMVMCVYINVDFVLREQPVMFQMEFVTMVVMWGILVFNVLIVSFVKLLMSLNISKMFPLPSNTIQLISLV